jgi:hypothetical protein
MYFNASFVTIWLCSGGIIQLTRRSNGQKTVGCFTPFTILANNFLPLNVALGVGDVCG